MSGVLEIRNDGRVRTVVMNRPEKKNALSDELAWGIIAAIEEAAKDDSVWIVGLTGTDGAFCAGLDLAGAGEPASPLSEQDEYLDDLGWVSRIPLQLREWCDKPVVAGINGVAVGAGLSLAMASDVRVMAESAVLMAGYPRIGASPDGGLSWTLQQAIGYEQAMRFLLENRAVRGEEALRLGMVGEVVPDDRFQARFAEYCQQLTQLSPITGRLTKRVLRRAAGTDNESQARYELATISRALASKDSQEARRAFLEKRDPTFEGR